MTTPADTKPTKPAAKKPAVAKTTASRPAFIKILDQTFICKDIQTATALLLAINAADMTPMQKTWIKDGQNATPITTRDFDYNNNLIEMSASLSLTPEYPLDLEWTPPPPATTPEPEATTVDGETAA